MKKIKGVIFDLDGTLANTLPLCIQAFRKSIEPLARRSISDEEIIASFGPSEEGTIMTLIPDHYEKGIASYLQFYETLHYTCSQPFLGIPEILTTLKKRKVKLAIVTGKGANSTLISLKQFALHDFFQIIETGSPIGPKKAEGIQHVLYTWKEFKKTEVIYVGDAPSDISASKLVGIPVVAAAWADTADPEKLKLLCPDFIFYRVEDFALWINNNIPDEVGEA